MRKSLLTFCIVLLVAGTAGTTPRVDEPAPLARLKLNPIIGKTTPSGPEFRLRLAIRNLGEKDLEVGKDFSRISNAPAYIEIGLKPEHGRGMSGREMISDPPPRPDWFYWTRIAPGNSYGTELELSESEYPEIYKPGRYTVSVWYTQQKCIVPSIDMSLPPLFITPVMHLKSNTVTIVTAPTN
jgi:hypothetical protein